MEYKDFVVQLYGTTTRNIGTAYPVANNVLLTAAHVVGDTNGDTVDARWFHQPDGVRGWVRCKEVLWDGRRQTPPADVVLLSCDFPDAVNGKWGSLAAVPPKDHLDWASEGFPFVGEKDSQAVPLQGKTHAMGGHSEHFHLAVTAAAATEKLWRGASGAPVFVNGAIIGVIVNSPLNYNAERFSAVPVIRLLENVRFRSLVKYSEAEDQRKQLTDAAVEELERSQGAMSRLSKDLLLRPSSDRSSDARAIVDKLLADKNLIKLGMTFVDAMRRLEKEDKALREPVVCLKNVAMHLIPALLATEHVQQIRIIAEKRDYLFQASTKTFVEFGMARLHGRPARYRTEKLSRTDLPLGILSLESPNQAEIDKGGEKFKAAFIMGLRDAMSLPDIPNAKFEEAVSSTNDELENRHDLKEGLHYYVFDVPENEDDRQCKLQIIQQLDGLFPRVNFVGLESKKGSSEENRSVTMLLRILFAAEGMEWTIDGQNEASKRPGQANPTPGIRQPGE